MQKALLRSKKIIFRNFLIYYILICIIINPIFLLLKLDKNLIFFSNILFFFIVLIPFLKVTILKDYKIFNKRNPFMPFILIASYFILLITIKIFNFAGIALYVALSFFLLFLIYNLLFFPLPKEKLDENNEEEIKKIFQKINQMTEFRKDIFFIFNELLKIIIRLIIPFLTILLINQSNFKSIFLFIILFSAINVLIIKIYKRDAFKESKKNFYIRIVEILIISFSFLISILFKKIFIFLFALLIIILLDCISEYYFYILSNFKKNTHDI